MLPLLALLLFSFSDPYTIKRITDSQFKYEFYTSQKEIKTKIGREYYWFKGGAIHHATEGASGEVLHETYVKLFLNNQLAEQGRFKYGLKKGIWKNWYPDGTLQSVQSWRNGLRKGMSYAYDEQGQLVEKGRYDNDKKNGPWINYTKKDTTVYDFDVVVVKKPKLTKEEKAANRAVKKEAAKVKKQAREEKRKSKKNKQEAASSKPSKPNFFQRLFTKKSKKQTNGQGE